MYCRCLVAARKRHQVLIGGPYSFTVSQSCLNEWNAHRRCLMAGHQVLCKWASAFIEQSLNCCLIPDHQGHQVLCKWASAIIEQSLNRCLISDHKGHQVLCKWASALIKQSLNRCLIVDHKGHQGVCKPLPFSSMRLSCTCVKSFKPYAYCRCLPADHQGHKGLAV